MPSARAVKSRANDARIDVDVVVDADASGEVISMIMVDKDIQAALENEDLRIAPFSSAGFKPIAYMARIGKRALRGGQEHEHDLENGGELILQAGEFVLFQTLENLKLCPTISGHISVRTSLARKGLVLLAGTHVEPGWEGHLVLGGYNASPNKLALEYETEVVSIEFHRLRHAPKRLARESKAQRAGRLPAMSKDYLRTLETGGLSELRQEVRSLAIAVGKIAQAVNQMRREIDQIRLEIDQMRREIDQIRWFVGVGMAVVAILTGLPHLS